MEASVADATFNTTLAKQGSVYKIHTNNTIIVDGLCCIAVFRKGSVMT